jgi:GNAT superfamily N-acetyltransferase
MSEAMLMSEFRKLFGENKFRSISKEYYEWKIDKNPYQKGLIVLERREGKVVGSGTLTPKKVSIFGEEHLAAEGGDAFTHPDYRRQGIYTKIGHAGISYAKSHGFNFIYGTPNPISLAGGRKFGQIPCPYVRLRFLTKGQRLLPHAVKAIVKMIRYGRLKNLRLFLSEMWQKHLSHSSSSYSQFTLEEQEFDVFEVDEFTDEIDGLWGSPRYIFFVIRDKTYLNWRYFANPDEYQVIVARKSSEYLGYVVTKISMNGKVGVICDFITLNDRMDIFHILIQEVEKRLEERGVSSIQLFCVESSAYSQALLDRAYYDHGSIFQKHVVIDSGSEIGNYLLETDAKWHFTLSDSDNI